MASVLMKLENNAERERWLIVKAVNTMIAGGMEWVEIMIATEMMAEGMIGDKYGKAMVSVTRKYIQVEDTYIFPDGEVHVERMEV